MTRRNDNFFLPILKLETPHTISPRFITHNFGIESFPIDREPFKSRKYFFIETLAFCMSLQNFWRFPREAYIRGQGAFIYLYIFFIMCIGSVILYFEIALGQHYIKGSSNIFSICPVFEGINLSMAIYCIIISVYYNILNVHSIVYFFGSFNKTIEYTTCGTIPSSYCIEGSSNRSLTPEYAYFSYRIIRNIKDFSRLSYTIFPNFRNSAILFFLWILVCIVILKGVRTVRWPSLMYCPIPFLVFTVTIASSLTVQGAADGLRAMFTCQLEDFKNFAVWHYALEQALVSLGLGIGPIITLASCVKYYVPTYRDSLYITTITTITALMAGAIAFCTAGILASEQNKPIHSVFKFHGSYSTDFCFHILLSQLIKRLPYTLGHLTSLILFFTLFLAGWYTLIILTETAILTCYTFFPIFYNYKIATNLGVCMVCCFFGILITTPEGYKTLLCIDHILIRSSVLIVIMCELSAVMYIYGINKFSYDISIITGFKPHIYIQFIWLIFPIVIMILYCHFVYFVCTSTLTLQEQIATELCVTALVVPIVIVAVKNVREFYEKRNITGVFMPRDETDEISAVRFANKNVLWSQRTRNRGDLSPSVAGPSTEY